MIGDKSEPEILRALSTNVLETTFDGLDQEVRDNARRRLLDMIGCAIGGAGLDDVERMVEIFTESQGAPGATVLGYGVELPVPDAAMVNCIMGRSFDWGPLTLVVDGNRIPSHVSETTVLTALAVGEYLEVDGEELLTAIVVGDDLATRIWMAAGDRGQPGESAQPRPGFEQWGTVTTFGATAIAGRLLGLTSAQLENAFGIAINLIAGAGHGLWEGATTFKLSQGTSARSGILAARLANAGWVGVDRPLFGERGGYYSVFETGCGRPEHLYEDLGATFHVEVCFKTNPGGRPTDAPIEAALALAGAHEFRSDAIEEVVVRPATIASHYSKPYEVGEYPTGHALFSYKYATANALLRGHASNEDYTEERIRDPEVQRLVQRTRLEESEKDRGAEVEVGLVDGRTFVEYVPVPPGDPSNPISWDRLVEKFTTQVRFFGAPGEEDARALIQAIEEVETLDDVSVLPALASGSDIR